MKRWEANEEAACRHLQRMGFRILERNFRLKVGEIDIIAGKGDLLVFCEVKSRDSVAFGRPFEAVTQAKIKKIRRVAEGYLAFNRTPFKDVRFDVISIEADRLEHIENAF